MRIISAVAGGQNGGLKGPVGVRSIPGVGGFGVLII